MNPIEALKEESKRVLSLEIVPMESFCALDVFKINGKDADSYDFGSRQDEDPGACPPGGGCGDSVFVPISILENQDVLIQYNITALEYAEICEKLTEALSFGKCGLCS